MKLDKSSSKVIYTILATVLVVAGTVAAVKKTRNRLRPDNPAELSWASWKQALIETKNAIGNKNLGMLASGIAYGGTLAFFPLVVACVAIASMVISQDQINDVVANISAFLPSDMAGLLTAQLTNAVSNESANFLVAVAAIALALFGVSGAMNSLVTSLNVAYQAEETRGFIKVRLLSIGLTCLMILGILIILPLIALGGGLLRDVGVPEVFVGVFSVLRWFLLAMVMVVGLAIIYRYGPDRRPNTRWQWVSWGAVMATLLWLIVTALFFIYVQNFSNFSDSYSLFAGIIVLMIWLNLSGLIVLVGAEVNNRLERGASVR